MGSKRAPSEFKIKRVIFVLSVFIFGAFFVYGSLVGWGDVMQSAMGTGKESNIQSIVSVCEKACQKGSASDWCEAMREVRGVRGILHSDITCNELVGEFGLKECVRVKC